MRVRLVGRRGVVPNRGGRQVMRVALLAGLVAVGATAGALEGQSAVTSRLSIAPRVGVSLPAGEFARLTTPGPSAAVRIGYQLRPDLALIADGGLDRLGGDAIYRGLPHQRHAPDMTLTYYLAGIQANLAPESSDRLSVFADLSAGARIFDTEPFRPTLTDGETTFEQTAFTAGGGLEVGYAVTPRLDIVGDTQVYWSPLDKDDTSMLTAMGPGLLYPFGSAVTLPVRIAVRARV